ncbi:MAG: OmpH family outer membrane protein, partial [Bacteroidota bacterium]|nr:OmpH family outer membrane protein [Bacteroidota bacterium]
MRGISWIVLGLAFLVAHHVNAQKFAYIDTDYVLLHLPEYSDAQGQLNQMAVDWQVEIEMNLDGVERLEMAYRAERVLLTQEMRGKREEEIDTKRRE